MNLREMLAGHFASLMNAHAADCAASAARARRSFDRLAYQGIGLAWLSLFWAWLWPDDWLYLGLNLAVAAVTVVAAWRVHRSGVEWSRKHLAVRQLALAEKERIVTDILDL